MSKFCAYKLLYYRKNRNSMTKSPKVHQGVFYAKDLEVARYLIWLARCPLGQIVPAREMGIDFTVPMMSPQ